MSFLISGGEIVTASDRIIGDVLLEDGVITRIGTDLAGTAEEVIDARGMYVFPGAVDPHTHLDFPNFGTVTADDFTSGTIAAAYGGTTTIIDFCMQTPGASFGEALDTWHEKLRRAPPVIDVGF